MRELDRVVIVHGGAWDTPNDLFEERIKGVERAAREALGVLDSGGSALDAVERAVKVMEDDPNFNAGIGSALNEEGFVELDAIIVDGSSLNFGSVAAVRRIKNPISLARAIMERTHNNMYVAEGAEKIAIELGFQLIDPRELITKRRLETWRRKKSGNNVFSTVGAVALDSDGNIAAATSTGGIPFKKPGRVGDSPLIGCGAFADREIGGASATGQGEAIMRVLLSKLAVDILSMGASPADAAKRALSIMRGKIRGKGGLILVDKHGRVGYAHTSRRMAVAYSTREGDVIATISSIE